MPAFLSPGVGSLPCPPAAPAAHAWMPSSPCGPDCVETAPEAGNLLVAARALGVGAVLVSFPVAHLATPRRWRTALHKRYARTLLHCCGIRLRIVDNRAGGAATGDCADLTGVQQNSLFAGPRSTGLGTAEAADAEAAPPVAGAEIAVQSATARQVEFATQAGPDSAVAQGDTAAPAPQGRLMVAGHIGWTDIFALSAVESMGFVARADMVDWPLVGDIARLVRVIPIERERLRALPGVVNQIAERLAAGERVGLFPEGTTWCGRARGRLRPALFQAAIDTGTPVQPIRLRYLDAHGQVSTVPGFVGVDTMGDSVRRVLRSRGIVAEIVLQPLELPGTDRRDLARRCERAIHGDAVDRAFAGIVRRAEEGAVLLDSERHPELHTQVKLPARV
ncbi:lysophospholipid acyltransferase family protein [Nocardia sp. NBC_01327]|uniref:lysophospholipid acyltransferase family protein n=1 Tax=Nocardia sp. NBC_01327 TaxID=2903593 RepID=UPI002E10285D|nr:1-acyl-sn-glycerol-3-phosphate acyltransferase [Nocardia sp. NBC_01327]